MMTGFRLHEPPHIGDIGEIDHECGSSHMLGVRGVRGVLGFSHFGSDAGFDSFIESIFWERAMAAFLTRRNVSGPLNKDT